MTKKVRMKIGVPGRNSFEQVCFQLLTSCEYEPEKLTYTVESEHTYLPDFVNRHKKIMFESKGRFRFREEANKYKHIRKCMPKGWELIFIFQAPKCPMPSAKKRKDGTKQSMAEWAETNGFRWYSVRNVPKELR